MSTRMVVIIDYQNVQLAASKLYLPNQPLENGLIDPYRFATRLTTARNRDGLHEVEVSRVEVFRGIPIPADDPDGPATGCWERVAPARDETSFTVRAISYADFGAAVAVLAASVDRGTQLIAWPR